MKLEVEIRICGLDRLIDAITGPSEREMEVIQTQARRFTMRLSRFSRALRALDEQTPP